MSCERGIFHSEIPNWAFFHAKATKGKSQLRISLTFLAFYGAICVKWSILIFDFCFNNGLNLLKSLMLSVKFKKYFFKFTQLEV